MPPSPYVFFTSARTAQLGARASKDTRMARLLYSCGLVSLAVLTRLFCPFSLEDAILTYQTLKARLAEILPEKAEEVKQLKKEHGKTVCIFLFLRTLLSDTLLGHRENRSCVTREDSAPICIMQ